MSIARPHLIACVVLSIFGSACAARDVEVGEPLPPVPVGYDAYRMCDRLPMQRLGVRAHMRSTYQRSGMGSQHNPDDPGYLFTDASHFLFYGEDEQDSVTLDVMGKGVLYFFLANHWHGSPWNFQIDGRDNIVKEDGTTDPANARNRFDNPRFIPYEAFPEPLNYTWSA